MVVRVFVAGGSGAMGRRLVPQLVARGHQVTATTTSTAKLGLLQQMGADAVAMDGLDAVSVGEAVAEARPDAIVHQMTGLSVAHAGKPDFRHPERFGPSPTGCAPRGPIICWQPPMRPAYPTSSPGASPCGPRTARADW
jgi:hypothetical protein